MTYLYIIRHAEAEGNLYRRVQGHYDSLVTEMGKKQIEALKKRFESIRFDAVYSSDLFRTRTTAAAIYVPKKLPLRVMKELREVRMGVWEDICWAEVERDYAEEYQNYNSAPHMWNISGCENFYELSERITNAVKSIAEKHDGQTVAIVTHGGAIRALLCTVLKIPPEQIKRVFYCDNTAVSLLYYKDGELSIEYMNDNSHLPEEISAFKKQDWWKKENFSDSSNLYFRPMDLEKRSERYLECYRDAWVEAHRNLAGFSDIYLSIAKKRSFKSPLSVTEVFLGDKPVGVLELSLEQDEKEGSGCIAFYYIDEEYRGSGLAVQLLGHATSVYRALGRKTLRLRVADTNERAIAFYKKYGFCQIGEEEGSVGDLLVMEKNISLE